MAKMHARDMNSSNGDQWYVMNTGVKRHPYKLVRSTTVPFAYVAGPYDHRMDAAYKATQLAQASGVRRKYSVSPNWS